APDLRRRGDGPAGRGRWLLGYGAISGDYSLEPRIAHAVHRRTDAEPRRRGRASRNPADWVPHGGSQATRRHLCEWRKDEVQRRKPAFLSARKWPHYQSTHQRGRCGADESHEYERRADGALPTRRPFPGCMRFTRFVCYRRASRVAWAIRYTY